MVFQVHKEKAATDSVHGMKKSDKDSPEFFFLGWIGASQDFYITNHKNWHQPVFFLLWCSNVLYQAWFSGAQLIAAIDLLKKKFKNHSQQSVFAKSASHIHRQENQLITVFQRYCLSSIERWAFRLSKTPLLARFHSNGESGRLDEVRGRRRWVGVLVVVELLRI